jgi:hypothetical protein
MTPRPVIKFGVLVLLALVSSVPASAETDLAKTLQDKLSARIAKLQAACGHDLKKYCSSVTPGEGRILYCLQAYEDKISAKCDYELEDAMSRAQVVLDDMKDAIQACRAEIAGVCGKVQPGKGRIAACLEQNKSTASKECADMLGKIEGLANTSDKDEGDK